MKYFAPLLFLILTQATTANRDSYGLSITRKQLLNKIMGGWAGQTIGVAVTGAKFKFDDTAALEYPMMISNASYVKQNLEDSSELYDDLYKDLTFIEVIENEGLEASSGSFAKAYAEAGYELWHANQIARYNLSHGIDPPASGYWLNNPHADDIDFLTIADFAGLISPGMPRTASEVCEKVGHIMSSGDGYYGGLYIANLYALAFTSNNIEHVVREAIKSIPVRSNFYKCINDVITAYRENPGDWKYTREALQKQWYNDTGCPGGRPETTYLDAKLNAANVTLALLYGEGDFTKTIEISIHTREGYDCNLSSAGGILGVMYGYDNIPDRWMDEVKEIEEIKPAYSRMSLSDAYTASFNSALKTIGQNDGKVRQENIIIRVQKTAAAKFEKSFGGHYLTEKRDLKKKVINDQFEFDFEGIGFVLRGEAAPRNSAGDYVFFAELYLNNKFIEKAELPTNFTKRRGELFWKFQLPHGQYRAKVKILNPSDQHHISVTDVVVYNVNRN